MDCSTSFFFIFIILFAGLIALHLLIIYPALVSIAKEKVPYGEKQKLPSWYRNFVQY